MARINFEDSLYRDKRFYKLLADVGMNEYTAKGILLTAWTIAQEWYLKSPHGTIPETEWKKFDAGESVIKCELARRTDSGVYVCGANDQFAWLKECQKRGSVGGKTRARNHKEKSQGSSRVAKGIQASSSSSFSFSNTNTEELSETDKKRHLEKSSKPPSADVLPPLASLWNKYRGKLPEVKGCGSNRRKLIAARWREQPSQEYWEEIIVRLVRSKFCQGQNQRGWRATFDFLIQPETQHKVREGRYDDKPGSESMSFDEIDRRWNAKTS